MKIVTAPAGTNPMEMPELIRRKRASKLKLAALIAVGVLTLVCMCGGSYYLYSNNTRKAAAAVLPTVSDTGTPTITPTATSTPTGTITPMPSGTYPPISTLANTIAATSTHIPPTTTAIVITKIVPGQDRIIEKWYPVDRTVVVTVPVTMTPGPTQTPWIITITEVVIETVIVEVTPTPTETPTEEILVEPSPASP